MDFEAHDRSVIEAQDALIDELEEELTEVWQRYVDANEARIDAEAHVAELEKALDSIKAKVCGDAYPYWTSSENVTSSRMWIADVCDAARRVREGGRESIAMEAGR